MTIVARISPEFVILTNCSETSCELRDLGLRIEPCVGKCAVVLMTTASGLGTFGGMNPEGDSAAHNPGTGNTGRGATFTIADFHEARELGPVVGTLFGKVTKGLRCLDGDALTVADFSGSVDIWVPRSVPKTEFGAEKWFEFDIVAEHADDDVIDLAAQRKALTEAAIAGDAQAAGALALDLIIAIQGATRPIVANSQRFVERK